MKFIWLMTSGLLFLAVLSVGSGFYTVLRFWVFFASLYVAYVNYQKSNEINGWVIAFGVTALIFNPFIPVYLYDKFTWIIIDIAAACLFLINVKKV